MNTPLKLSSKMNFSFFCKNNNNQGNPVKKHKPFMEREGDWVCSQKFKFCISNKVQSMPFAEKRIREKKQYQI